MRLTDEEIENSFGFHPATPEVKEKYEFIRGEFTMLAMRINATCPDSREKSLALTNLQQAQMWAIGSVAINETPLVGE